MNNFLNILTEVATWSGAILLVAMVAYTVYSLSRLIFKLQAESRLERELAHLAKQDVQVRRILMELESQVASKSVNRETYNRACEVVTRAARRLKAEERSAILEGRPLSLPHMSKIVQQSLGLEI